MKKIKGFNQFNQFNNLPIKRCNIAIGCRNDCAYCHQKYRFAIRFKDKNRGKDWISIEMRPLKNFQKLKCQKILQIPTTSDIFDDNVFHYIRVIRWALLAGYSEIQITTKARWSCVSKICDAFTDYKKRIHFFITITSDDDIILHTFEPNAPMYDERREALIYAFENGFRTSLLIEPYLSDPRIVVRDNQWYVTDKIYIGKMNYITQVKRAYYNNYIIEDFNKLEAFYRKIDPELRSDPLLKTIDKVVWKECERT